MKVKIYIALSSEMRINAQFKNTSANQAKSDLLTKRLVLLPKDWDKNVILFTKRLHMKNKINGSS